MPIKKTPVDELVVFGYDLKQRRVYLGTPVNCLSADSQIGEISPESAEMFSRVLDRMEDEFSRKPIEVHLSTFGGCVMQHVWARYPTDRDRTCNSGDGMPSLQFRR